MDIYKFINSKDVRKYLKEINYEFTTIETAWLIWQSTRPIEERHKAWQEMIDTMPDVTVEDKRNDIPSLHQFLKEYMQLEKRIIDRFYNPTCECVFYQYSISGWYNGEFESYDCGNMFLDFSSCYEAALSDVKDLDNPAIEITMNSHLYKIKAVYCEDMSLMQIFNINKDSSKKDDMDYEFFKMWFPIPMPFKKGDIVVLARNSHNGYCRPCNYEPYVLDLSSYDRYKEDGKRGCDYSDMCVWGYSLFGNGQLNDDEWSIYNYMDLEYYTGELTGEKRVLKALSNCLKNKIDAVMFAKAYYQILTEKYFESTKIEHWRDEYLKLAGLKEE